MRRTVDLTPLICDTVQKSECSIHRHLTTTPHNVLPIDMRGQLALWQVKMNPGGADSFAGIVLPALSPDVTEGLWLRH